MALKDVCKSSVVCTTSDVSAADAARLMRDKHVGELVVVKPQDKKAIGTITDRDLVTKVMANNMDPRTIQINEIMVRNPTVAKESDGLFETARKLEQTGIRRLPVIDDQGHLTGIVSIDDLYELFATELSTLSKVSARQIANERVVSALTPP